MEPRKWNTFAADRVVFRLRGFTVFTIYNLVSATNNALYAHIDLY